MTETGNIRDGNYELTNMVKVDSEMSQIDEIE